MGRALIVNGAMVQTGSGALSSTGALTVSGAAAVFDLGASHSATAATVTVDGGGSITGTGTSGVTATASFEMKSGAVGAILRGTGIPLNKTTAGTVTLTGANTYTGATTAGGGVLRLDSASALPGGLGATGGTSRLIFNGGVLGLGSGDFNRGLGTGAAQAGFTGSGGFAAYTANRSVNLGGAGAGVAWDTGSFVPTGSALVLGATTADATVTFQNPIHLGGAVRTVQVDDGSAALDAVLTGALTGSVGSGLTKTGAGTLTLDGPQTYATLTTSGGTTNVNSAIGTGSSTVFANATTNFLVSQTLAGLYIGSDPLAGFTGEGLDFAEGGGDAVVPEPAALGLLTVGALGFLGRRPARARR